MNRQHLFFLTSLWIVGNLGANCIEKNAYWLDQSFNRASIGVSNNVAATSSRQESIVTRLATMPVCSKFVITLNTCWVQH